MESECGSIDIGHDVKNVKDANSMARRAVSQTKVYKKCIHIYLFFKFNLLFKHLFILKNPNYLKKNK